MFNEKNTTEEPILEILKELGYSFNDLKDIRRKEDIFIEDILIKSICEINKCEESRAEDVFKKIEKISENQEFYKVLIDGVQLLNQETNQNETFYIIDFDNINNNNFLYTKQLNFLSGNKNIRPDIVVYINGIPISIIEAKSPIKRLNAYKEGISQLIRYQEDAENLFIPNCFNVSSDGSTSVYGATGSKEKYYINWNDKDLINEFNGNNFKMFFNTLYKKENILDIINNFILFDYQDGTLIKKIARYQQFNATNKIVKRFKEKKKKKGLIWHTQGSGKSITMNFVANKIRKSKNIKIFIIVDRIDLNRQFIKNFSNCGVSNVFNITSRQELADKIKNDERGIFISTIQKAIKLTENSINKSDEILIMVDEAHREDEGIAAMRLRASMPNASIFGFTGTPIDNFSRNTFTNYQAEGEKYLDLYSIKDAVDDGVTIPISYSLRLPKYLWDEQELIDAQNSILEPYSIKKRNEIQGDVNVKEVLYRNKERIKAVAKDIHKHFLENVDKNNLKAQLVVFNRELCVEYKKHLDKLFKDKNICEIIMSYGQNDEEELRKFKKTAEEEEKIIENFKKRKETPKILIVCNKLLTGFDAPIEQTMYLDKPLKDHNLLQAIARVNRTYSRDAKSYGLIVDYCGITKNLKESLSFDKDDIENVLINIKDLKKEYKEKLDKIFSKFFNDIDIEAYSNDDLLKILNVFKNEKDRVYFEELYKRLVVLYEVISPDIEILYSIEKIKWLSNIYIAYRDKYYFYSKKAELVSAGNKLREIIKDKVEFSSISEPKDLNNIMKFIKEKKYLTEEEKYLQINKKLSESLVERLESEPYLLCIKEKLEEIENNYLSQKITLEEAYKKQANEKNEIAKIKKNINEKGIKDRNTHILFISLESLITENKVKEDTIKKFAREINNKILEKKLEKDWKKTQLKESILNDIKKDITSIMKDLNLLNLKNRKDIIVNLANIIYKNY